MKKLQLTKQTGIIIAAAVVAIVLVCLLLFLPSKGGDGAEVKEGEIPAFAGMTEGARAAEDARIAAEAKAEADAAAAKAAEEAAEAKAAKEEETAKAEESAKEPAPAKEAETEKKNSESLAKSTPPSSKPKETGPTITITIDCKTILSNMALLEQNAPNKVKYVPKSGIIYSKKVTFTAGETLNEIIKREAKESKIKFVTGAGGYIKEIGNFSEFDCGSLSGWLYSVNGTYPGYSASLYKVKDGDNVAVRYSCDLGKDIGASGVTQG